MKRFFQSPEQISVDKETPLVFLEGPVQGAPDWQTPFARKLLDAVPGIAVATPRALPDHQANLRSNDLEIHRLALDRQIDYEFLARRLSFHYGVIALWYAAQDPSIPYPAGRLYAKTSEKEDSEVWGYMVDHPDYPFVVGYEPGFRGKPADDLDYNNRNHRVLDIPEHNSLDDVFNATIQAIELAKKQGSKPIHPLTSQSIQRAWDRLGSE